MDGEYKELAPQEFQAYTKFNGALAREDGAIDPLNRELIAVGVAISSQRPYCIQLHVTKAEIAETTMIAAALAAGSAVTHGTMAFRTFDEA